LFLQCKFSDCRHKCLEESTFDQGDQTRNGWCHHRDRKNWEGRSFRPGIQHLWHQVRLQVIQDGEYSHSPSIQEVCHSRGNQKEILQSVWKEGQSKRQVLFKLRSKIKL